MTLTAYPSPRNIHTDFKEALAWKLQREYEFQANSPLERATTYYFDTTRPDNTGDGLTLATAKKDATELAALAAADRAFLFVGGQRHVMTGPLLEYAGDNLTIAGLDTGGGSRSFVIDRFSTTLAAASSSWTLAAGNRYTATMATEVAAVKLRIDPLGLARDTNLVKVASSAACESTANSWYWTASTIHLNLNGDNPDTYDVDLLPTNTDNGVEFSGDGCRLADATFYGFGCDNTTVANQNQGATNASSGDDANYYERVSCYYSGSHAMAHYLGSGSGGRSYWKDCDAGYTRWNSSGGETVANSYSSGGGQETWFDSLKVRTGTLKSSDWDYATDGARAKGVFGHTATGSMDLGVMWRCTTEASHTPCRSLGAFDDTPTFETWELGNCRNFIVGCSQQMPTRAMAAGQSFELCNNVIHKGCSYAFRPNGASPDALFSAARPRDVYWLDTIVDLDLQDVDDANFGVYNGSSGVGKLLIDSCFIRVQNNPGTTGTRFGIDYDTAFLTTAAGNSDESQMSNSIVAYGASAGGNQYLGLTNLVGNLTNNAFFGVTQDAGDARGYDNDSAEIALAAMPVPGVSVDALVAAGTTRHVGDYDGNFRRRSNARPSVGPFEFLAAGGNLLDEFDHQPQSDVMERAAKDAIDAKQADFTLAATDATGQVTSTNGVSAITADEVAESRTFYVGREGSRSRNIVTLNTWSTGTVTLAVDFLDLLNPDTAITSVDTVTVTNVATGVTVTTSNLRRQKGLRKANFDVASIASAGRFDVVIKVTSTDTQPLTMAGTLAVE